MDETETGSANFFGPIEATRAEAAAEVLELQLDITPVIVRRIEDAQPWGFERRPNVAGS